MSFGSDRNDEINRGNLNNPAYSSVYTLPYFSGSQAAIYIGDIFIDEVTSIQYKVTQSKTPIYGYASQLFDVVAPGVVLVDGAMSINFKEAGYLWLCLARYKAIEGSVNTALQLAMKQAGVGAERPITNYRYNQLKNVPFIRSIQGEQGDVISRANIQRLVSGEATTEERFNFYNSLAGFAGSNVDAFERIANQFESEVWGLRENADSLNRLARRVDDNAFDDVDLYITFGDVSNPNAPSTVRRLMGVHFTSQGQTVQADGENVQEFYTFIARNVV